MTQTLDRSHPPHTPEDFDFRLPEIASTARDFIGPLAVEITPEQAVNPEAQRIRDDFEEIQNKIREANLGESIWPKQVRSANRVSLSIDGEKIQAFPIGSELAITPTGTLFLVVHRDLESTGAVSWKKIGPKDLSNERTLDVKSFFSKSYELNGHRRAGYLTIPASSTTTKAYIEQKHKKKCHPLMNDLDI